MDIQGNSIKNNLRYLPLAIIGVVVIIYWITFRELLAAWMVWDQSLSHGIPLALVFLYLVFVSLPWKRNAPKKLDTIIGVAGVVLSSAVWFAASLVHFQIVEQLSLLPLVIFSLVIFYGVAEVWMHRLILLVPIYIIPVWDFINQHLVDLSGLMVGFMVNLSGLPAMIDGNSIHIPSGQIIIAGGCSGLRYLIISLALAHIISCLNGYKEKGLASALLLAASLGLLTNWVRIFLLIIIGHVTEMKSSLMEDHEFFGWILFGCVALPAIYFAPVVKTKKLPNEIGFYSIKIPYLALLIGALLIGPTMKAAMDLSSNDMPVTYQIEHNKFKPTYGGLPHLSVLGGISTQDNYVSLSGDAYLQINQYLPSQNEGRLVPYIGEQFDIEVWKKESQRIEVASSRKLLVQVFKNKNTKQWIAQVRWLDVGGIETPSVFRAKLGQLWAIVTGHNYFSLITLQQVCVQSGCDIESKNLIDLSEFVRK